MNDLNFSVVHEELVPLGAFWSGEWHAASDKVYASTAGRDRLELMRDTIYPMSNIRHNVSLFTLASQVLENLNFLGITADDYWIDPALQDIIVPVAWLDVVSHREALRQIAEAALGQVYCDRNGIIRVEGPGYLIGQESYVSPLMSSAQSLTIDPDDYFRKDTPVRWGELANHIEVETQPRVIATTRREVMRHTVTVEAGQTITRTYGYPSPPVTSGMVAFRLWEDLFEINQLSSHYTLAGTAPLGTQVVTNGALSMMGGTDTVLLRNDVNIWNGDILIQASAAHDSGVVFRYMDSQNYCALFFCDDLGVSSFNLRLGRRWFGAWQYLGGAQADVAWPHMVPSWIRLRYTDNLIEVWFDGSLVISVTDSMFGFFGAGPVGLLHRAHTAHTETRCESFMIDARWPEITSPWRSAAGHFLSGNRDAIVGLTSAVTATGTLVFTGMPVTVEGKTTVVAQDSASRGANGVKVYRYPANGLVQTTERAQTIADTLLRLYRHPRRDLIMDWRGNPALTLGDTVIVRDHQDWLRYWAIRQEIDYDGALRARLEGRLIR